MKQTKDTDVPLNFGPITSIWMDAIGIHTVGQLEEIGIEEAFRQLVLHRFNANALMLYALEARLEGIQWYEVSQQRRNELKNIAANIKKHIQNK